MKKQPIKTAVEVAIEQPHTPTPTPLRVAPEIAAPRLKPLTSRVRQLAACSGTYAPNALHLATLEIEEHFATLRIDAPDVAANISVNLAEIGRLEFENATLIASTIAKLAEKKEKCGKVADLQKQADELGRALADARAKLDSPSALDLNEAELVKLQTVVRHAPARLESLEAEIAKLL